MTGLARVSDARILIEMAASALHTEAAHYAANSMGITKWVQTFMTFTVPITYWVQ